MRHNKIMLTTLAALLFVGVYAINSHYKTAREGEGIILNGKFSNLDLLADSVELEVYSTYIKARTSLDASIYKAKISNGGFSCKIPRIDSPVYIRISQPATIPDSLKQFVFLSQPADSINMVITDSSFSCKNDKFSSFECQLRIYNCNFFSLRENMLESNPVPSDPSIVIRESMYNTNFIYAKKNEILNSYRGKIDEEIFQVLQRDLIGEKNLGIYKFWSSLSSWKNSSSARDSFYNEYLKKLEIDTTNGSAAAMSKTYCDYIFVKELIDIKRSKNRTSSDNNSVDFGVIYNVLRAKYTGILFDKLMVTTIANDFLYKFGNIENYFDTVIAEVKDDYFKSIVEGYKRTKLAEGAAYNFRLPDSSGRFRTLDDFRGKLVVVDFWFTGCTNCVKLTKAMEPIVDSLKDRKDVVFLSVNIDNTKDLWINSLKHGKYTHSGSVNVSTYPSGSGHPIIKYYQINGAPHLILINKEGNILNARPPIPTLGNPKSAPDFLAMIENYFNKQ